MLTDIKVMKAKVGYLQMMIDGQVILMREEDCLINATQIFKLTPLTQNQQRHKFKILKNKTKVQYFPARGTHGPNNTWIDIREGKALCVELGLEKKLQPLLDRGLGLHRPPDDDPYEISVNRLTFARGYEKSQSRFIEIIYNNRRLAIQRSDWRINCTHIANQIAGRSMVRKLLRDLPANAWEVIRLSSKYTGTYVDFDHGIDLCKTYNLIPLADQLLELRRTETEQAAAPIFENPVDESYAIPVSPRPADFYHSQPPTVAGQSNSKESPALGDSMVTGDTRKSKSEGSEEGDDPYGEDDESSVDTDSTQLHVPRLDDSDDEVSLRQLNNDTETNVDQRVQGRISYYSYENFESRNSGLKKVNLDLQAPSKISSQYGSMTDVSRSFMLAAWDG